MLKNVKFSLLFLLTLLPVLSWAQTQTLRGRITDKDSKTPLPGINVVILGTDPLLGAATDTDGYFKIQNVKLGRVSLKISGVGYEEQVIPNISLEAGKETVLQVGLAESFEQMEGVEIVAAKDRDQPLNDMAFNGQTFSMEETQRTAGALSDPSRMASTFAGVVGDPTGNNDIIVRGNSPRGMLWRIEGIPAPNPNHFAGEGATGGPVNSLNPGMLANSDFFSGAFAPEYGNATSSVFDINFRNGNSEKHEQRFSLGLLGADLTLEGPLSSESRASYLVNYRYSSLGLLDEAGVVDFGGVPQYQDASFKFRLPFGEKGMLTLFGLGGVSSIENEDLHSDTEEVVGRSEMNARLGFAGAKYLHFLSDKTYIEAYTAVSHTQTGGEANALDPGTRNFYLGIENKFTQEETQFGLTLNRKINSRHRFQFGGRLALLRFNMFQDEDFLNSGEMTRVLDTDGKSQLIQAYGSWKWRITPSLTAVSGIHAVHFRLNESTSIEPRLALNFEASEKHTFTFGTGLHSRLENLSTYMASVRSDEGSNDIPNRNLGLTRSAHFVIGHSMMLGEQMRLKTEAYFQHHFNVPIGTEEGSTYSVLNSSEGYINRELINEGLGRNYGLELTLERFFHSGFYFTTTVSVYDAKYKAQNDEWRNSRYNGQYAANVLGGKEFELGKKGNKTLGINLRASLLGGQYYTPFDVEATLAQNQSVFREDNNFGFKGDDIFFLNLGVNYRVNRKRTTHELMLEIQNITNHQGRVSEYYNSAQREFENAYQIPLIPNFVYSVEF